MAMNSSGPISLAGTTVGQSIALEVQLSPTAQISLNDVIVRELAGIPTGAISMPPNFWGTTYFQISLVSVVTYTSTVAPTAVYWWKVDGVGTATYLAQAASYNLPYGFQMFASKDASGLIRSNVVGQAAVAQFFFTGGDQTLTIPSTYVVSGITKTVTSAKIEIWGAGGAYAGYTRFDNGAVGTTYHMIVGAAGGSKIAGAMEMYYNSDYYGYQVGCAFVSTIWPYDGSLNYLPTDDSTLVGVAGGATGASSNSYGGGLVGGNGSGYAGVTGGTQTGPGNMGDGRGGAAWYGPGKLTGGTFVGSRGCTLSAGAGGYYPGGPTNVDPCVGQAAGGGSGYITSGTGITKSPVDSGYISPPSFGQGSNGLILVYYNYA
jgi:hypothetical protein